MIKYWLFELLRFVVRILHPRLIYAIGAFLAEVTYLFPRESKRNLRANLIHILSYRGEDVSTRDVRKKIRILIRKNFRNFSYYLVDFFRFSQLSRKDIKDIVELTGTANIDHALSGGRGALGVTAHLGNWELGGMLLSRLGYPVNAIALSHQNTRLNRLFVNQRALSGMKVVPVGKAVLKSLRALKKNELVLILGDRDVTERGIEVTFFGAPAHIPRGPAGLAVRSGADIFFGYFIRESTHRFKAVFRPPLRIDRSAPWENRERQIITGLVKEMEECIVENLTQWYMYYRIWP
ncbi:MAG: lysophospholipid acyltransferase family protein [Candidatus Euphemobacter frigidus]|nr:lysophospholipid acyltransferase family protein [Candidatus Euphemobacter frigidus]